jgi:predicted CXXCH cytochrome family protein
MKAFHKMLVIGLLAIFLGAGCAYHHYMGSHGPSIKQYPDVHQNVSEDRQCLECHDPHGNSQGPATTHPNVTGCLKCHNDDIK